MVMSRVTDIDGINDVDAKSPLVGLFLGKGVPLSLHQCFVPIAQFFRANGNYTNEASTLVTVESVAIDMAVQLRSRLVNIVEPTRSSVEALSIDESAAIFAYTFENGPYRVLNSLLRDRDRDNLRPFVDYLWLLMHALSKCPRPIVPTIYRGVRGRVGHSEYLVGKLVVWPAFSSCTTLCSVLSNNPEFLGVEGIRTQFHITLNTNRARSIAHASAFANEAEVLLPPNTKLEVTDVSNHGNGLIIILLNELPCSDPILLFQDEALGPAKTNPAPPSLPPPPAPLLPPPPPTITPPPRACCCPWSFQKVHPPFPRPSNETFVHDYAEGGRTEQVREALNHYTDLVNARAGRDGNTALMMASAQGHIDVVRLLLDNRAQINIRNNNNRTALYWANQSANTEVLELLKASGAKE